MEALAAIRRPWLPVAVAMACCGAALVVPAGRHLLLYQLLPQLCLAGAVLVLGSCVSHRWLAAGAFACIAGLHLASAFTHPPHLEPDSYGYIAWAQEFSRGNGFPGMILRGPGYPFLLGLTFLGGSDSLLTIVLIQHGALIAAALLVYLLALECGLDRRSGLVAMILFGCNSLIMQIGQWIMTEAIFAMLVMGITFASVKFYRRPGAKVGVITGACFAAADLVRPMLLPLLAATLLAIVLRHRRRALPAAFAAIAVYAAMTLPWSVRNFTTFGAFGLSSGRGVQLFTKATSYALLSGGPARRALEPTLSNVARDLGVDLATAPRFPEDDWTLNRVPHVLTDSLTMRHGRSFVEADRMLRAAAFESFAAHPGRYIAAVGRALSAMLFTTREIFPRIDAVAGIRDESIPAPAARIIRGLLYIPGILVLLFPAVMMLRRDVSLPAAAPFFVLSYGYLLSAAVQVGFTRYALPWSGCAALCAAYILVQAATWVSGAARALRLSGVSRQDQQVHR